MTFENFRKSIVEKREQSDPQALTHYGEIDALIDLYRATARSALFIFDELTAFNQLVGKNEYSDVFDLKDRYTSRFAIIKKINGIFWNKYLYSEDIARLLTNDVCRAYSAKFNEMKNYEFNERNILQLKEDLAKNFFENVDAAVMKV